MSAKSLPKLRPLLKAKKQNVIEPRGVSVPRHARIESGRVTPNPEKRTGHIKKQICERVMKRVYAFFRT